MRGALAIGIILCSAALAGCMPTFGPRATQGITFYCPGVANVDLGDAGIREGLEKAGYQGQVARVTWSVSFNPVIDQTVRFIARQGAQRLAGCIQDYMDKYPEREVNVVGLSAGTGVALWAVEALKPGYTVNNVVLISSSLSHDYDVSDALRKIKGGIYNYYSSTDAVLAGPMKVFGTIDGVLLVDAAGAVGLRVPPGATGRVVNVAWREEFAEYGYVGGHGDGTSADFVMHEIAPHLIVPRAESQRRTALASPRVTIPRGGHPD
jgi:pimeloyl-ACP methyl ester carboxylesterase